MLYKCDINPHIMQVFFLILPTRTIFITCIIYLNWFIQDKIIKSKTGVTVNWSYGQNRYDFESNKYTLFIDVQVTRYKVSSVHAYLYTKFKGILITSGYWWLEQTKHNNGDVLSPNYHNKCL